MRIRIDPEAIVELSDGALWYDRKSFGLGDDFVAEVHEAIGRIADNPSQFGRYEGGGVVGKYQRALVKRFPYVIIFEAFSDEVVVHSISHGAQRPGYWENR
ncbi:hypothetical protein Pla108_02050 [Botrimarina colliarenosi]|uniref:Plasmid stabilization system protein n=1 Tax=Botrimarina colliarenosi TaxID=2528001 RepID=A0A5C6AIN6_9BACT|nr:type II toxin-antitoxin system RelE/ParE family toxin [Botrimarina colliarenosi]TWT99270.1 hypothetical protein Pla108_02050 [Botrimarina colliarenosi]